MLQPTDVDNAYATYSTDRSQSNLSNVVKSLGNTINYSLASVNARNDPLVRSKAMLFAADAVEKFDPSDKSSASLPTFVTSQLRQLSRFARQSRSPIHLADRVQLDSYRMNAAKKRYYDENGRDADIGELADFTGMPVKRIAKIHKYQLSMPSEGVAGDVSAQLPDYEDEAVEYIYNDSDHTDRRILEHKTGYGGQPLIASKELAGKLNLTPAQLSRRSMRMSMKINEIRAALEKL